MANENNNQLLQEINALNNLPKEKGNITDQDKNTAKTCFAEIFKNIADDYKLSSKERDILASYMPIFGAEAKSVYSTLSNQADFLAKLKEALIPQQEQTNLQTMSADDKTKIDEALNKMHAALFNSHNVPKNFGSNRNAKDTINNAIQTLNTSLENVNGEFSPEQVTKLKSILQPFNDNTKLNINTNELLGNAASQKKANPAFKQLYAQLNQQYQQLQDEKQLATYFTNRLQNVHSKITNNVNNPPLFDNQKYLDEIRASNTLMNYLANIGYKISPETINSIMQLKDTETFTATESRAIALSNVDDMLVTHNYYANKYKGDDKTEKLKELNAVIAQNLTQFSQNPENITPDNAFALLTLADKLKDDKLHKNVYDQFTQSLTGAMQKYDYNTYGQLPAETLAQNYENADKGLHDKGIISDEFLQNLVKDYTFTDDKGKELKDKNRGLLNPLRHLIGKGNERKETLDSLFETARLLAAKELAKEGVPNDPELKKALLQSKMQEAIGKILALNVDETLTHAAELIAQVRANAGEDYEAAKKETLENLLKGNTETTKKAATVLAQEKYGLQLGEEPSFTTPDGKPDYKKQQDYIREQDAFLTQVKDAHRKSTSFTKSELAGRLGGVMSDAHAFKTRTEQHYPKTGFCNKVSSWWHKVDKKLTKWFGKPYIIGKKICQTVAKVAPGIAKGIAISTIAGLTGPVGIGALTGYYAFKNWQRVATDLKDKNASTVKKVALVTGALITTALSAATATAGLGGTFDAVGNSAIGQVCANITQHAGIIGKASIAGFASSMPNIAEAFVIKNKRKKLQKQINYETDPVKLAQLATQQKDLDKRKALNNSELLSKGVGIALGMGVGTAINGWATNNTSSELSAQNITSPDTTDIASMQKDMDMAAAKIGLTPEQATSTMENLAKGFGNNSYEAMHAALADPYSLAQQMGISTNDLALSAQAATIDVNHNYSGALLNHLATHPELASNEGFQSYVSEHFDAQDRFHFSTQSTPTPQAQPAPEVVPQAQPAPEVAQSPSNSAQQNFRVVRLEDLDKELPKLTGTAPTTHQPTEQVIINGQVSEQPVYQIYTQYINNLPDDFRPVHIHGYDKFVGTIDPNNGLETGPIFVDHEGNYYRTYTDPHTGEVSYAQTTLTNIRDQIQYQDPYGRGYYGSGNVTATKTSSLINTVEYIAHRVTAETGNNQDTHRAIDAIAGAAQYVNLFKNGRC